jgi:5-methylcytosine-specific restriction endonuclease McrA
MSHANPTRDLATVVERALDLLLEHLERTRLGALKKPKPSSAKPVSGRKSGVIPRAVRREVFERDGEQCTYVAPDGRRCSARAFLELDHIRPRAQGGGDEVQNLRVRCHAHNQLWAEQAYGCQHVAMRRHFRQQKSTTKRAGEYGQALRPEPRSVREDAFATVLQKACGALEGLGFRKSEAQRALDEVERECAGLQQSPEFQQVLRTSLCLLSARG